MGKGEIDPQLPFIQVHRSAGAKAAQVAPALGVTYQHARGAMEVVWESLCDRRLFIDRATGQVKEKIVLPEREIRLRLKMAFGKDVDLDPFILAGFLEEDSPGHYRIRGMSMYLNAERGRLSKKHPPGTSETPDPDSGHTRVPPRSDPGPTGDATREPLESDSGATRVSPDRPKTKEVRPKTLKPPPPPTPSEQPKGGGGGGFEEIPPSEPQLLTTLIDGEDVSYPFSEIGIWVVFQCMREALNRRYPGSYPPEGCKPRDWVRWFSRAKGVGAEPMLNAYWTYLRDKTIKAQGHPTAVFITEGVWGGRAPPQLQHKEQPHA